VLDSICVRLTNCVSLPIGDAPGYYTLLIPDLFLDCGFINTPNMP